MDWSHVASILDSATDAPIVVVDEKQRVKTVSAAFCALTGWTPGSLAGLRLGGWPLRFAGVTTTADLRGLAPGETLTVSLQVASRTGDERALAVAFRRPDNRKVRGLVGRVVPALRPIAHDHAMPGDEEVARAVRAKLERLSRSAGLTPREHSVLELLSLGRNRAEIGTALGISINTVKFHQGNVLTKLGADSRAGLLSFFV